MRNTLIFSGTSCPDLTKRICENVGMAPAEAELSQFSNGETSVRILTSTRDKDVFVVQSGSPKINDTIMELLIMISACKGGSANKITAVLPYFPYNHQSKKKSHRGAITARMLANLLHVAGVRHVITVDLHASQMQGFFQCPVDNLHAEPLIARWIRLNVPQWREAVVVSKNAGGTKRVTSLADALKLNFGLVTTDKKRSSNMTASMILNQLDNPEAPWQGLAPIHENGDRSQGQGAHKTQATPEVDHRSAPPPASNTSSPRYSGSSRASRVVADSHGSPRRVPSGRPAHSAVGDTSTGSSRVASQSTSAPAVGEVPEQTPLDGDSGGGSGGGDSRGEARENADGGYDDDETPLYNDGRADEVTQGRLVQGHIVPDDFPSPSTSASVPDDDPMVMSHASSFFGGGGGAGGQSTSQHGHPLEPHHALGGSGDAESSDEEEDQLRDPRVEHMITLVGNVRGRTVFIVDDMIDKPGSWIAAAETVVKKGKAKKVYCIATHGVFGADCLEQMQACDCIDAIVVTDSYPIRPEKARLADKLVVLDLSHLLAEAIRRNHHGESISPLFQHITD